MNAPASRGFETKKKRESEISRKVLIELVTGVRSSGIKERD